MTSMLCQSAVLDRILAPWTAKIAVLVHTIVETILTIAEIVRTILHETMGHARLLRHRTGFLRPLASALHADIDVSLSAEIRKAWQASSPQVLLNRIREEQPAEANGDEGKLMDLGGTWAHDTGSERRTCPHVKYSCGFANPMLEGCA